MGMDILGRNPTAEVGCFYRVVEPYWHPVWEYCEHLAPDIIDEENLGHSNDGWGLDDADAMVLAERIEDSFNNDYLSEYLRGLAEHVAALPDEVCSWCEGTGTAHCSAQKPTVLVVLEGTDGEPVEIVLRDTGYPENLESHCRGCNGSGKVAHWRKDEEFSIRVLADFGVFLRHCGGFRIW